MDFVQHSDIYKLAVKKVGKPAVFVSNGLDIKYELDNRIWSFIRESMEKIYGSDTTKLNDVIFGLIVGGLFFFETEQEQNEFYHVFTSDLIPPVYRQSIYACAYDQNGESLTENTLGFTAQTQ